LFAARVVAVLLASAPAWPVSAQGPVPVAAFAGQTHIHGLAFDRGNPGYLFIATHHGLFRAGPDATATQISIVQDFMGFTPHPTEPQILFASGHPAGGGNLGFIVSADGGETWVQRATGVGGPADFHQLAASPVDPDVIYGVFGLLQVSADGGASWAVTGRQLPPQLVDLAASAVSVQTVYAAAESGLYVTADAGATWRPLIRGTPVSLVEVAPDGSLYAFVLGQGLLRAPDEQSDLTPVGGDWVEPYLFHLAVDPSDANHMFAATAAGRIVESIDGGRSWAAFGA
jgi:photosystem II stability/assembly factor-like uncharacterized protein